MSLRNQKITELANPLTRKPRETKKATTSAVNERFERENQPENTHIATNPFPTVAAPMKGSIESTYQRKTQLEHILLRPETYIGSIHPMTEEMWVFSKDAGIHNRAVTIVPGLYKLFDEILVNAADHKQRDPKMSYIRINIDAANNVISVENDGSGIPVVIHKTEGVYVPEMIFGSLLTGSNYNDEDRKVTGGRNGYGAKLTNIFSELFIVETCDAGTRKKFKQVFKKNMSERSVPEFVDSKAGECWTRITFKPDLKRFDMSELDSDIVDLFQRRVYDIAGITKLKVYLNGELIPIRSFYDYVKMFYTGEDIPKVYESPNPRWEVCVIPSDGNFQHVSFVNGIHTQKGGEHVEFICDQITKAIISKVSAKLKGAPLRPSHVKLQLFVFVNCIVENPSFDSQLKNVLVTNPSEFGSSCILSDEFHKKVFKTRILENVMAFAHYKQTAELRKTDGKKSARVVGMSKLDDANHAGGKESHKCTLILTEGDSAKALAISGLSEVGRDYYGVFPLKGKLLNVRDATAKQALENVEIAALKKIIGLQQGKEYENANGLRYGRVMIMTDQDHDGSHIKGLLINLFHTYWPSLLKINNFLVEFVTPIVKAKYKGTVHSFYSLQDYQSWRKTIDDIQKWTIKYYKGLGTSTQADAKEYFRSITKHTKKIIWSTRLDDDVIELAFSKRKADERKDWLRSYQEDVSVDYSKNSLTITDFVNQELIHFSMADNVRSIPSIMDGFKPGQRKIMFSCFKRNLSNEIKVSQLAGYVSEVSSYHHGEASLTSTIIGMAQNYIGSNNINLLSPEGQFGTRHSGGKDAASPRYIYTALSKITRKIFNPKDEPLLNYLEDDGQIVEPKWYAPVLPMVLVNGCEGIGTGWSTFVPNFNPREIVDNLKRIMHGNEPLDMKPWYYGHRGEIRQVDEKTYVSSGVIEKIDSETLRISELPVGVWIQNYKEFLEGLMGYDEDGSKKKSTKTKESKAFIKDFKEYHTDTKVDFLVRLSAENMQLAESTGLEKKFKLLSNISVANMHLFDSTGKIRKYDSCKDVLKEFCSVRLPIYAKRKASILRTLNEECKLLQNKIRFIQSVISGSILLIRRSLGDLINELARSQFDRFHLSKHALRYQGYGYLLEMPMSQLTQDLIDELRSECAQKEYELNEMEKKTEKQLWIEDLDLFIKNYIEYKDSRAIQLDLNANNPLPASTPKKTTRTRRCNPVDNVKPVNTVVRQQSAPETAVQTHQITENIASIKTRAQKTQSAENLPISSGYEKNFDLGRKGNDLVRRCNERNDAQPLSRDECPSEDDGDESNSSELEDDEVSLNSFEGSEEASDNTFSFNSDSDSGQSDLESTSALKEGDESNSGDDVKANLVPVLPNEQSLANKTTKGVNTRGMKATAQHTSQLHKNSVSAGNFIEISDSESEKSFEFEPTKVSKKKPSPAAALVELSKSTPLNTTPQSRDVFEFDDNEYSTPYIMPRSKGAAEQKKEVIRTATPLMPTSSSSSLRGITQSIEHLSLSTKQKSASSAPNLLHSRNSGVGTPNIITRKQAFCTSVSVDSPQMRAQAIPQKHQQGSFSPNNGDTSIYVDVSDSNCSTTNVSGDSTYFDANSEHSHQ